MSWRRELISSGKEAKALFERAAKSLPGVLDLNIDCTFDPVKGSFDATATGRFPDEEKPSTLLLLSAGSNSNREFRIGHVRLHDRLKNHIYGSLLVKIGVGIAHEHGENLIYFSYLGEDSPKICASYGGMPLEEPRYLADVIEQEINRAGENGVSCPAARKRLQEMVQTARQNPFLGWRILSQEPARVLNPASGKLIPFRHLIFPRFVIEEDDMVLFVGDRGTQAILRKRLGVLPPFRPLEKGHPHSRIREALTHAPVEALQLRAA
jgi:hypothetical protein